LLSLIVVLVALVIGATAGWYVVVRVFELAWAPDWAVVAMTLMASVLVTLGIGLLGSLPALRARPADALREL
jgi:putative ABC transport system permease protein